MNFFDNVKRKVELSKAKARSFNRERDVQRQNKAASDNLSRSLKETEAKEYLAQNKLKNRQEATIRKAQSVKRENSFVGRASRVAGSFVKNVERARSRSKGGKLSSVKRSSLVSTRKNTGGSVDRSVFNLRR